MIPLIIRPPHLKNFDPPKKWVPHKNTPKSCTRVPVVYKG